MTVITGLNSSNRDSYILSVGETRSLSLFQLWTHEPVETSDTSVIGRYRQHDATGETDTY
jgi:hypothetical protein